MKWFYVTGCDSGFGRIVIGLLDAAGHGVFAGVYLEASVSDIKAKFSDHVVPVLLDVTSEESVEAAAAVIRQHLQGAGLDGVVNNAGLLVTPGPVEWTPNSSYEKMFKVNVYGMAAVTKSVLPLIRRNKGRIVNVASIAGRVGLPSQPAYCASKFAVEGYSDVLRHDMRSWGVTVHIIEPGVFPQTGLYDTFHEGFQKNWHALPDEVKTDYGEEFFKHSSRGLKAVLSNSSKMNKDSSLVPQAMVEALTSPKPKFRYRVGFDSKYVITPLTKVHESWQDGFWSLNKHAILPAGAPADGKAIAKQRYASDPVPWYVFGVALALGGVRYLMRSRM